MFLRLLLNGKEQTILESRMHTLVFWVDQMRLGQKNMQVCGGK
jgi:hypothetical protein